MEQKLTLTEHLEELRSRIIKSAAFVIIISCLIYAFVDPVLTSLIRPVGRLVFIAPQEALVSRVKLSLFAGLFLSSPVIIYQIWRFVSSALKPDERRYITLFGPLSLLLFFLGAAFGYFVIVPIGIKFLLGFATEAISPMISMNSYISFVCLITISFGLIFELPLMNLFLVKIGLITPQFLSNRRRHAVVLVFIVAAILTPPDVITQCLMALPLLVLYEMSIIFSRLGGRKK